MLARHFNDAVRRVNDCGGGRSKSTSAVWQWQPVTGGGDRDRWRSRPSETSHLQLLLILPSNTVQNLFMVRLNKPNSALQNDTEFTAGLIFILDISWISAGSLLPSQLKPAQKASVSS